MIYKQKHYINTLKTPIRAEGANFFGGISTFMTHTPPPLRLLIPPSDPLSPGHRRSHFGTEQTDCYRCAHVVIGYKAQTSANTCLSVFFIDNIILSMECIDENLIILRMKTSDKATPSGCLNHSRDFRYSFRVFPGP